MVWLLHWNSFVTLKNIVDFSLSANCSPCLVRDFRYLVEKIYDLVEQVDALLLVQLSVVETAGLLHQGALLEVGVGIVVL